MSDVISWMRRQAGVAVPMLVCGALLAGAAPALADGGHGQAAASSAHASPTPVVDLNAATEADLQALPGIGPAKAKAIVALRKRLGRFQRVEQILRVRGIGRATFRKLQPMLRLGPARNPGPPRSHRHR